MRLDTSARARVLTLLLGDQSPKLFLIFFERVLGSRCMKHNLEVPPEYLHQPPKKGCRPVLALFVRFVNANVAQVAWGLFVVSTRPSTLIMSAFLGYRLFDPKVLY